MNVTWVATNRRTGVSLATTMASSFCGAYDKAVDLGLDMRVWVVCKA